MCSAVEVKIYFQTRLPKSRLKVVPYISNPIFWVISKFGGGGSWWPTSNFWCRVQMCQNPKTHYSGGGGGGDQLPTFDAESKSTKISKSHYNEGWGWKPNFSFLMLSPNLLKSKKKKFVEVLLKNWSFWSKSMLGWEALVDYNHNYIEKVHTLKIETQSQSIPKVKNICLCFMWDIPLFKSCKFSGFTSSTINTKPSWKWSISSIRHHHEEWLFIVK